MEMDAKDVVTVIKMERRRRFLGLGGSQVVLPERLPDTESYVCRARAGGVEIDPLSSDSRASEELDRDVTFLRVRTSVQPLDMVFAAIVEDDHSHKWDVRLKGSWSIIDCRRFLCAYGLDVVLPMSGLAAQLAESWIANSLGAHVRDAVRNQAIEDLREKDALPTGWWDAQMPKWLSGFGVSAKVKEVCWQSAEAANWQAEQARLKDLARIEEERERQRQAELREDTAKASYDKEKARIEADLALSAKEREHQLQVLELHHRRDLIQAEREVEDARRAAEKAAAEHVIAIGQLRHDRETVKTAAAREDKAQERHDEVVKRLAEMESVLARLAALPENLLARLADRDVGKANAAAERLVSPEFGIPASALAGLGFRVERQNLIESLRQKAIADGEKVTIRKAELVTRDIGTAKVKGLPINSSLQFQFSTERAGYVTLLNIGTSGAIYVHVPNAYVTLERAKADGPRSYAIPGPELLPWERMRQLGLDYVEVGPPGWEHIAVLVSDGPVISPQVLAKASSESPFVKLGTDDIADICETLNTAEPHSWSAAVLSFLVG
jgi:hypothetical protein